MSKDVFRRPQKIKTPSTLRGHLSLSDPVVTPTRVIEDPPV